MTFLDLISIIDDSIRQGEKLLRRTIINFFNLMLIFKVHEKSFYFNHG